MHCPKSKVPPQPQARTPVALQGQAVKLATGDRGHAGEAARHAALPEVVVTATPGEDGAVALQGQAVKLAGGDRGHAGEAARHAALPEVEGAAAAPGEDGPVALQGQAVKLATGDRGHAGEAARHAALPEVADVVDDVAAPGYRPDGRRRLRRTWRRIACATPAAEDRPHAQHGQRAELEGRPRSRRHLDLLLPPQP